MQLLQESLAVGTVGQELEERVHCLGQANAAFKSAAKHVLMHLRPVKAQAPKGKAKGKSKAKATAKS